MNQWRQQIDKENVSKQNLTSHIFDLYSIWLIVCYGSHELCFYFMERIQTIDWLLLRAKNIGEIAQVQKKL